MTNLDIRKHAAQFAKARLRSKRPMTAEDAWYLWSTQHGVSGPAARLLFEAEYEARLDARGAKYA